MKYIQQSANITCVVTGRRAVLEVAPSDTIAGVKRMLENQIGATPDQQRIEFAGKQIEDHKTLADYNIDKGSTIHIFPHTRVTPFLTPLVRGSESEVSNRVFTSTDRLPGAIPDSPVSSQPISGDHQDVDTGYPSSTLNKSRIYPAGTRRIISKDDQTYCLDENHKVLAQWSMGSESEPAPCPPSLDNLADTVDHIRNASRNASSN